MEIPTYPAIGKASHCLTTMRWYYQTHRLSRVYATQLRQFNGNHTRETCNFS